MSQKCSVHYFIRLLCWFDRKCDDCYSNVMSNCEKCRAKYWCSDHKLCGDTSVPPNEEHTSVSTLEAYYSVFIRGAYYYVSIRKSYLSVSIREAYYISSVSIYEKQSSVSTLEAYYSVSIREAYYVSIRKSYYSVSIREAYWAVCPYTRSNQGCLHERHTMELSSQHVLLPADIIT